VAASVGLRTSLELTATDTGTVELTLTDLGLKRSWDVAALEAVKQQCALACTTHIKNKTKSGLTQVLLFGLLVFLLHRGSLS
jgi:hypothetical protein